MLKYLNDVKQRWGEIPDKEKRYVNIFIFFILIWLFLGGDQSPKTVAEHGEKYFDDVNAMKNDYEELVITYEPGELDYLQDLDKDELDEAVHDMIKKPKKVGKIMDKKVVNMSPYDIIEGIELTGLKYVNYYYADGSQENYMMDNQESRYNIYYDVNPSLSIDGGIITGGFGIIDGNAHHFIISGEKVFIHEI